MRILYAIYAAVLIYFLWNATGDTAAKEIATKVTLVLWCAGLVWVIFKIKWYELVALLALVPVMGLLLFQTAGRISFIIEHGGMDCATCNASPLAFLMGWATESVFLIPGVIICIWLVRSLRLKVVLQMKSNQSSQRDAKTAAPLWFCHPCWLRYIAILFFQPREEILYGKRSINS